MSAPARRWPRRWTWPRPAPPNKTTCSTRNAARGMSEAQYVDAGAVLSADADAGSADDAVAAAPRTTAALPLYTHFTSPIRRYGGAAGRAQQLWRALRARVASAEKTRATNEPRERSVARLELSRDGARTSTRARAQKAGADAPSRRRRALRAAHGRDPRWCARREAGCLAVRSRRASCRRRARVLAGPGRASAEGPTRRRRRRRRSADAAEGPSRRDDARVFDGGVKALAFVARGGDGGEREICRLRCGAKGLVAWSASGGETRRRASSASCWTRATPAGAPGGAGGGGGGGLGERRGDAHRRAFDSGDGRFRNVADSETALSDHTPRAAAGAAEEKAPSTGEAEELSLRARRKRRRESKVFAGEKRRPRKPIAPTLAKRGEGGGDARRRAPKKPWGAPTPWRDPRPSRPVDGACAGDSLRIRPPEEELSDERARRLRREGRQGSASAGDGGIELKKPKEPRRGRREARRARRKRRAADADLRADATTRD